MNTSQTVHADTTDPVETEEVESAKKTTTDTGNDQTTTAGKNDNDTTAQKEVSGTDPLTSKNSTEQNSTKQAEDKKATSLEDTKDVSTQNNKEVSYSAYNKSGDPTWNKEDTSSEGKESLAYTENASVYEARPVHTVLYIPVKQQARTVTAKYVIAGGDKNGQQFAPDSQIQVFYAQTGSLNVANNTITYGNGIKQQVIQQRQDLK